jgi:hypothetical protein
VGHALSGHALLALGRAAEAEQALVDAERELALVPSRTAGIAVSRGHVQPWIDQLRGERLLRQGRGPDARRVLEDVAGTLRGVPGPDAWIQALFRLEAIARLAREAGDWELAGGMARQMLEHDPAYAGSHLALALVAEHHGDAAAASEERGAAERLWRDADPDLPELAAVRRVAGTSRR